MSKICQSCKYRKLDKERCEPIGCNLVDDKNPLALNVFLMGSEGKCPYYSKLEYIR